MLDVMFELPTLPQPGHFVITDRMVRGEEPVQPAKAMPKPKKEPA